MRWATIVTTYLSVCTCMSVSKWVCMCLRGIYGCPSSFIHSFGSCEAFEATNSIRIRSNTCTTIHKSVHTSTHGTPSDKRIPCPTNEYTCHWRVCYELRACVFVCASISVAVRKLKLLNHTHISSDSSICSPLFHATWDFISLSFQNCSPFFFSYSRPLSMCLFPFTLTRSFYTRLAASSSVSKYSPAEAANSLFSVCVLPNGKKMQYITRNYVLKKWRRPQQQQQHQPRRAEEKIWQTIRMGNNTSFTIFVRFSLSGQ